MSEAAWALVGVVIGTLGTGFFNWILQSKQFAHNKEMFLLQNKSAETVKALLVDMLNHRSYTDRSFAARKTPIGGYSDDEVRQFLHEVGAKKAIREDGSAWWYLLSGQEERIAKKQATNA